MNKKIFFMEDTVRFADTDAAGIVYFGAFATYSDESFLTALRQNDLGWARCKELGFILPIVEQKINFFHPLRIGDTIRIAMGVTRIGNKSLTSSHIVFLKKQDGTILAAKGYLSIAVVDLESFKSKSIQEELFRFLEFYSVSEEELLGSLN
ncbi:MAG: acyl-CoA thioesterase [Desulfobacterales bacterium]|nr:acyl-CoA thioesterase [Desulfobacterales bacterium]